MRCTPRGHRSPPPARRRSPVVVLGLAAALVLAGCGADADSDGSTQDGPSPLSIGYFPLVHTASAVHAEETGLFTAQDLDVELVQTAGGAQAIPGLLAGEYDITYGNYTSALLAAQKGLPVRVVAGNDVGADDHAIMVTGNSPLQSAADLSGASIAVNNLQNIGTVAVNAVLEDAGVDIDTIDLVELAYPDMQAALERGDVDAIWQVEPFQAQSLAKGSRVLFPLFSGPMADMPVAGWLTTDQYATEHPEEIEAFRAALAESVDQLQDDRARLVELVPTYTQVPAEVVGQVAMPHWDAEVDAEKLATMADLMLKFGIIAEPFDVSTMVLGTP
jgi:ABC-type nitrate/sulfonate/bicarbonate transport system substrate-binding protein